MYERWQTVWVLYLFGEYLETGAIKLQYDGCLGVTAGKERQKQKIQPVTLMNVSYVLRGAGVTIQITTRKIKATLLAVNRVELKKRGGNSANLSWFVTNIATKHEH